jgi:hypothetical protein
MIELPNAVDGAAVERVYGRALDFIGKPWRKTLTGDALQKHQKLWDLAKLRAYQRYVYRDKYMLKWLDQAANVMWHMNEVQRVRFKQEGYDEYFKASGEFGEAQAFRQAYQWMDGSDEQARNTRFGVYHAIYMAVAEELWGPV